jgi:ABC-type multidrug transport system fused ATPase/permease subunit
MVLQDPLLLSGSVAENIRYGRLDASDPGSGGGAGCVRARLHHAAATGLRYAARG